MDVSESHCVVSYPSSLVDLGWPSFLGGSFWRFYLGGSLLEFPTRGFWKASLVDVCTRGRYCGWFIFWQMISVSDVLGCPRAGINLIQWASLNFFYLKSQFSGYGVMCNFIWLFSSFFLSVLAYSGFFLELRRFSMLDMEMFFSSPIIRRRIKLVKLGRVMK